MKILVTGATGFLGGALVKELAASGIHEIVATGRRKDRGNGLQEQGRGVRFVPCYLEDRETLIRLCKGMDRVFHCGALSSPWGPRLAFERANVEGTRNVIEGCLQSGVARLIYVSSPSVYPQGSALLVKEDARLSGRPLNHYIATKRRAEILVTNAVKSGLNAIVLRPRAIFGPGDESLFPRILRVSRKGRFPMIGASDPWMDCTYVDNVVDALVLASEASVSYDGNIYNITNGEPVKRSKVLEMLFAEVGMPFRPYVIPFSLAYGLAALLEIASKGLTLGRWEPPLTRYTVGVLGRSQTLDIAAARKDLHYGPKISVAEGIKRFGAWWREQELRGRRL